MKNVLSKFFVSTLIVILCFSFSNFLDVKAQPSSSPPTGLTPEELNKLIQTAIQHPPLELTEQDKILQEIALRFLIDVAKLDTSQYQVEVYIDNLSGPNYDKTLKFNFSSTESKVDALFLFKDNSFFWCTINPVKGSPVFFPPKSSDVLSTAKDTLDELQEYSATKYLPVMRSMLDRVTELINSKITNADFTQEIAVSGNTVRISWEPMANGLSNPQNKLTLEFQNGNLGFFCNYLGLFDIGNVDVKVSEQEAIKIALEHARNYSWETSNETISNVNVLDKPVIANLSLQNRENNTLYPYWNVWLPLDKMYPGGITAFHVTIWADTGEVEFISPIGYGGDSQTTPTPFEYSLIIVSALIAATTIIGYLFYKRKR